MNRGIDVVQASKLLALLGLSLLGAALGNSEPSGPPEVAPQVPGTRHQVWASLAWSEQAQCWLVAWREGYLNEQTCDIWCARVAADGTTLDPKGIRLTDGGLNNRPRVASDGKNFLVVWERYRPLQGTEGGDWDVVARQVSGDGVPGSSTVLIAGGAHNQCRPDVVFAKGHYFIAWMAYARGVYSVQGLRYSPGGTASQPFTVARHEPPGGERPGPMLNVLLPVLAVDQNQHVWAIFFQSILNARDAPSYHRHLTWRKIDTELGQPVGPHPPPRPNGKQVPGTGGYPYEQLAPAWAFGPSGALLVCRAVGRNVPQVLCLSQISKDGELVTLRDFGSPLITRDAFYPLQMRPSIAYNGKEFLVVSDCLSDEPTARPGEPRKRFVRIIGWRIREDGQFQDDGFVVAGTPNRQCLLPAVAPGPKGTWLVVYSEVRGLEDVKVCFSLIR